MKRSRLILFITTIITLGIFTSMPTYAGIWKSDTIGWWYDNEDGTYANNGWYWIDGNNDHIEESYYFDEKGWLLIDTVTPDGYQVNKSGQWVLNGEVQIKDKTNTENENGDKKKKIIIKSIAVSETGRPYSSLYTSSVFSSKWKLKTIISDKTSNWIPTFVYNEKGYLVENYRFSSEEVYDVSTRKMKIWEQKYGWMYYSYDNSGKIIRRWQLDTKFEGVPTDKDSHWAYEYDSTGKLTKETNYVNDLPTGTQYVHAEYYYYYDTYGRLIRIVTKPTKRTPGTGGSIYYAIKGETVVEEFDYNDYDRTIKCYVTYDGKGGVSGYKAGTKLNVIYKTNEDGNIIEELTPDGKLRQSFNYDADGRLIKTVTGYNGEILGEDQYIYE